MATTLANLVHETSVSTSTGDFTISSVFGKQTFNAAFGTGGTDVFDYFISSRDANEWERGTGHLSSSTTLVRDTVLESSNADAVVNFAAGTKDVSSDIPSGEVLRTADIVGEHTIWVPAVAMLARITNGPDVIARELATNDIKLQGLAFDQTTEEAAQFYIAMPKSWDEGTVTARFFWTAASGSGGVTWGLAGGALSDNDAMDAALGTEVLINDTLITADDMHCSNATAAITVGGTPAEGDMVIFELARNTAHGGDTLTADAELLGCKLFFQTDALNDT